jgi:hypothetical protein
VKIAAAPSNAATANMPRRIRASVVRVGERALPEHSTPRRRLLQTSSEFATDLLSRSSGLFACALYRAFMLQDVGAMLPGEIASAAP